MNIFVLDSDPAKAAQYHTDKHVIKMLLESAQLLCNALHEHGSDSAVPYRRTHQNHPCSKWVAESLDNWEWLKQLAEGLNDEYRFRWNREVDHKSWTVIKSLNSGRMKRNGLSPFALAMSDELKQIDAIAAYRRYYLNDKRHLAKWTKRGQPDWWIAS